MDQKKIGSFIAKLRKAKQMTQEELAEKLGVNSRSVSRWETGTCMPDLSLFKPLSTELEVSVNELLSGERIEKEKYQEKFEENVVNVVSDVKKKNRLSNIIVMVLLGILVFFTVWFWGSVFCENVYFTQSYNAEKMIVMEKGPGDEITDGDLWFNTNGYSVGKFHYLITTYTDNNEKIGVIFLTQKKNIRDILNDRNRFSNDENIDLTYKEKTGGSVMFISRSNIPEHYKVYYTKTSFQKIAKANEKELMKIIKKSNLMFEKNN